MASSFVLRAAVLAAYAGAAVSSLGILFIVLFYVGFLAHVHVLLILGPLNDLCILVQYALAVPLAIAFHRLLHAHSPRQSLNLFILGLAGMVCVVLFQALLLLGAMPFRVQLPLASGSILVIGAWLLITGVWARHVGTLRASTTLLVGAALYFGYPFWAYRVAQQLSARGSDADLAA